MQIGELAKRAGFAVSQIRYYERRGLLPPPARSQSGYRIYGEADAARLRLFRRAKLLGLSLAQVGELLETAENGCCNETEPAVREAVLRRIDEVDRQIAELQALRATLAATLAGTLARGGAGPASDEACGSDFCLTSDGSEAGALRAKLPERALPLLAVGECCQPDCGPETCG